MAIFYNKIERGNPSKPEDPKKWYAVLKTISLKREKEIAQLIADETTLNRKEAEMALSQFEKILIRLLLDGHSVQLGDWGSFYLTCNSEGSETKEEVTVSNIKKLNIRFLPGKALKEGLEKASFVSAESMSK